MRRAAIPLCLLAAGFLGDRGARAHDFWLEPATLRPAAGESVPVRIRVGEGLIGELVPRNPYSIVRFDLVDPAGAATPAPGAAAAGPAASVVARQPGLHWIAFENHPAAVEVSPSKFAEYLEQEGLEKVAKERTRRGETGEIAREAFARSAKAALCVAGSTGSAGSRASASSSPVPLGLILELVAESDPCDWRAGSDARFRLLFRGKPLAGTLVQALHSESSDGATRRQAVGPSIRARTDGQGRVTLKLDRPGFWLIKAVETERTTEIPDVEWRSFWASMTFELRPPP